jgi:hypothetical protein
MMTTSRKQMTTHNIRKLINRIRLSLDLQIYALSFQLIHLLSNT